MHAQWIIQHVLKGKLDPFIVQGKRMPTVMEVKWSNRKPLGSGTPA